ncbi:MAG: hypothetical protein JWM28_4497 [Chitinophagaceae bacterium]|nr:hypothetical protein [Chitinophagaceae bacterium]
MEDSIKKFLEFNGKSIYFLAKDGQYWVALKPICDALEVNYNRQFQNLKIDPIMSQLFAKQQMVGADNRLREMVSLPEKYVYGWMFKLQSSAPGFDEFQVKCYDLLYDYFHGTIARRISALKSKHQLKSEISELEKEIDSTKDGQRLLQLKKQFRGTNHDLHDLDIELNNAQIKLF